MLSNAYKMAVIEDALENGNNIELSYVSVKGEKTTRVVQPEEFLNNNRIFVGFDVIKEAYRRFIVDNILSISEVKE